MSKSINESFMFEVNKDTEWNKPFKPKANVATDRVSSLIKTEPKPQPAAQPQPDIKKERVQHQPPNAPAIDQKRSTQPPVSGPIPLNVTGQEKIDYNAHLQNIFKYRLRGPNKHLFIAYYTLFTKPVYDIYTRTKCKEPAQYIKDVSQAYNMDAAKCSTMFGQLNRWLYASSSVQRTEHSFLYRASDALLKNQRQGGAEYPPYQQQQQQLQPPQQQVPPKDKFITDLPKNVNAAIGQTQEKTQYPPMGVRYPQAPYGGMPFEGEGGRMYPPGRMYYDDYYNDPRMARNAYPPPFDMYGMDYPPRYPPPYYYDRYGDYDRYPRYPDYDARSPRGDLRMDPRAEPRMPYDKYDRVRGDRQSIERPIEGKIPPEKQGGRPGVEDPQRGSRLPIPEGRPPQLNEMQSRDIGRDIRQDVREISREMPRDIPPREMMPPRDPRDIPPRDPRDNPRDPRHIPREIPRDPRDMQPRDPRDIGRDIRQDVREIPRDMPCDVPPREMMPPRDPRDMQPRDPMARDPREIPRDPRLRYDRYDMRDGRYMGHDMMRDPMYMDGRFDRDQFPRDPRDPMGRDPRDMMRDPRDPMGRDPRMMDMRPMDRMGMEGERMPRGGPMEKDPRGHMSERMFPVGAGERDRVDRQERTETGPKGNFVPRPYK